VVSRPRVVVAWLVHGYTALGLVLAFLALLAAVQGHAREMFLILGLACLVDATDGTFARAVNVARHTPEFDGRKLDDITDYLTYVMVPMFFAYHAGVVTQPWVCGVVLLASGYAFCRRDPPGAKASFIGFPSYWNVVVFYLYMMRVSPLTAAVVLLVFAALVFEPMEYTSPLLPPMFLALNTVMVIVWVITLALMFINFDNPDARIVYVSLAYPAFHMGLSRYVFHRSRAQSPPPVSGVI